MTISDNIFCVYFGLFAKNSNKVTKHKQVESIYTTGENRLRNQLQDVVKYEMEGERIRVQYMIANQSAPDVKMVLRKAGYTGGG